MIERVNTEPRLVLLCGLPASGKTALVMQMVLDALRLTGSLRACVCNVEMSPRVLLDRQLARLSGVDVTSIRYRRLGSQQVSRIHQALPLLEQVAERLCFVKGPYDLSAVAAAADEFRADLLVLDYIQRIAPPGDSGDKRGSVNQTMSYLRQFAEAGAAVVAVAAVGRTKDSRGRSSYDGEGLNLASFRESSELEFGADDAFVLVPDANSVDQVVLRHLKARHTEARDLALRFDRAHQSFTVPVSSTGTTPNRRLSDSLAAMWERAPTAPMDRDDGEEEGGNA